MAELGNKDKDFWEAIRKLKVIVLMETWLEKKGWKLWKKKLPRGYRKIQFAERRNRKRRAIGKMAMGLDGKGRRDRNKDRSNNCGTGKDQEREMEDRWDV